MRYSLFLLVILSFCFSLTALSQPTFTLHGVISRKLSAERVTQVLVTNLRSRDVMMSDDIGWFTIKAAIGDTLLFTKKDYTDQKITIISTGDMPVYMQPEIKLDEVKIKGETKKQELEGYMKDYGRKGVYYNGDPPLASILLNPLNDLSVLFGKDAKNLRRFKADSKDELEYTEVHRRYTKALVMRVTTASDSTAKKFMEYYTPSYQDLKGWNDYELIRHIRTSYEYYDKSSNKERLQNINAPEFLKAKSDTIK